MYSKCTVYNAELPVTTSSLQYDCMNQQRVKQQLRKQQHMQQCLHMVTQRTILVQKTVAYMQKTCLQVASSGDIQSRFGDA